MAEDTPNELITIGATHRRIETEMDAAERAKVDVAVHAVLDKHYNLRKLKKAAAKLLGELIAKGEGEIERLHGVWKQGIQAQNISCTVYADLRVGQVIVKRADTGEIVGDPRPLSSKEREFFFRSREQTLPGVDNAVNAPTKLDIPEVAPDADKDEGLSDLEKLLERSTMSMSDFASALEKEIENDAGDDDEKPAPKAKKEKKAKGTKAPRLAVVPAPAAAAPGPFKGEGDDEKPGFQAAEANPWNTDEKDVPRAALEVTGDRETLDLDEVRGLLKTGTGGHGTLATGHTYVLTLVSQADAEGRNPLMLSEGDVPIGMIIDPRAEAAPPAADPSPDAATETPPEDGEPVAEDEPEELGAQGSTDDGAPPVDEDAAPAAEEPIAAAEPEEKPAPVAPTEDPLEASRKAADALQGGLREELKAQLALAVKAASDGVYPADFATALAAQVGTDVPDAGVAAIPALVAELVTEGVLGALDGPLAAKSGGPLHFHTDNGEPTFNAPRAAPATTASAPATRKKRGQGAGAPPLQ